MTDNQRPLDLYEDTDQIIEIIDANRAANSPEHRLAVIQAQASNLADTNAAMMEIAACLETIEDEHPDTTPILDDLYDAAGDLVNVNNSLRQTVDAATTLAAQFRQQREAAIKKQQDLRQKIESCDIEDPSIQRLAEMIEEEQLESIYYAFDDMVYGAIGGNAPLDFGQCVNLWSVLISDELPHDSPLWEDLKAWIETAKRAILEGDLE